MPGMCAASREYLLETRDSGDKLGSEPWRDRDWLLRRESEVTLVGTLALRDGGR